MSRNVIQVPELRWALQNLSKRRPAWILNFENKQSPQVRFTATILTYWKSCSKQQVVSPIHFLRKWKCWSSFRAKYFHTQDIVWVVNRAGSVSGWMSCSVLLSTCILQLQTKVITERTDFTRNRSTYSTNSLAKATRAKAGREEISKLTTANKSLHATRRLMVMFWNVPRQQI